jgi:phage tail protein X
MILIESRRSRLLGLNNAKPFMHSCCWRYQKSGVIEATLHAHGLAKSGAIFRRGSRYSS